jgi:hypothetical protein
MSMLLYPSRGKYNDEIATMTQNWHIQINPKAGDISSFLKKQVYSTVDRYIPGIYMSYILSWLISNQSNLYSIESLPADLT